jgi:glycosyltransferase involved in cell wall biosynthesis
MPFLSYFITAVAVWLAGIRARVMFNQGTPTTGFLQDRDFSWRTPLRRQLFAALTRFFYSRADAVVVTSEGVALDLVEHYGVPRPKIRVLHNPVDVDAIAKAAQASVDEFDASSDHPAVVAAGRLAGVKNYPLLIDAIAELSAPDTAVHAWILGEGAEQGALEQRSRAKGVAGLVRFLGFQKNPWRFIARADVFVLTSTYEGFGNVLVEAMACGTPVVATKSPGTLEIVQHESNGLLVDHEASAVASAIARILNDGALRDRLIANARASVSHYATPRVAERYDRLFSEAMA